jgi:formylmethanofuran dehydrogenase subunit E
MSEKKLLKMVTDAKIRPLTKRCPRCKREFPSDDKMWSEGKEFCKLCEIIERVENKNE